MSGVDVGGESDQRRAFVGDVLLLARDLVVEVQERAIDDDGVLIDFIFQEAELAVIFLERARKAISRTDVLENESRLAGIAGDGRRELVQRRDVGVDLRQLRLRLVPLGEQFRVAGRRAHLQARTNGADAAVIGIDVRDRLIADGVELRLGRGPSAEASDRVYTIAIYRLD